MSIELNERNETLRRERDEQAALAERLEEAPNQLLQSEKMASIGQLAAGLPEINNPIGYVNFEPEIAGGIRRRSARDTGGPTRRREAELRRRGARGAVCPGSGSIWTI